MTPFFLSVKWGLQLETEKLQPLSEGLEGVGQGVLQVRLEGSDGNNSDGRATYNSHF